MVPFTLVEDAEVWFYSFPSRSITTWEQMETTFLNEYFPTFVYIRKRYDIVNFKHKEGESLGDAYKIFKRLLVVCHTHNLDLTEQMQMFLNGRKLKTKQLIDTVIGGSTNFTTTSGIKKIIEVIVAKEHLVLYDWSVGKLEGVVDFKLSNQAVKMKIKLLLKLREGLRQ